MTIYSLRALDIIGGILVVLSLSVAIWAALRARGDGHKAVDLLDRLNVAIEKIGELRTALEAALTESARLRMALEVSNVENGRLRAALDVANIEVSRLRTALAVGVPGEKRPAKPLLLAQCNKLFGEDDALAIRRTGIPFHRLQEATAEKFDRYLQAMRQDGTTPWWVQISAHMGPSGILFADGVRSTGWLSQRIRGVRVLLLAGCENEEVGGQLVGLAKSVVVVYESIESEDAQNFTFAFWREIGDGQEPNDAFAAALEECPQVSEFVQMRTARM